METNFLQPLDITIMVLYIMVSFLVVYALSGFRYADDPGKARLMRWAFLYKLAAGLAFAALYDFYYKRIADTFYYFYNASYLGDMLFTNPKAFFMMMLDLVTPDNVNALGELSYYPRFRDPLVYATHRFLAPFTLLGADNYYTTTLVINIFLFFPNWSVFSYLDRRFPRMRRGAAAAVLFLPSAVFWSSGIIKDTFTFTFSILLVKHLCEILIDRRLRPRHLAYVPLEVYVLISLKPYILFAIVGALFGWLAVRWVTRARNALTKALVLVAGVGVFGGGGVWVMSRAMESAGGAYADLDTMMNKAALSAYDLKQEYYQGNSFDIGDYDPTLAGMARVAPAATLAGLLRPFLWEARSATMLLSGLENMALLALALYVLLRMGPRRATRMSLRTPILAISLLYAAVLALGVGISTSNFGALVRFRIPMLPFMAFALLYLAQAQRLARRIADARDNH